jgi:hypothetical protein
MKIRSLALTALLALGVGRLPAADPAPKPPAAAADAAPDMAALADRRLDEMLNRMQAAVEEIAGLYGNPTFLQVFTNDPDRAAELKLRLRTNRRGDTLQAELKELEAKRQELLGDIALKQREAERLAGRLVRQRAALDSVSSALEAARKAVEDTAK